MSEPEPGEMGASAGLLRGQGLVKDYPDGRVRALKGVTLEIGAGESVAITGPSGCGKSTLLHLLGGLDRPDQGEVYFNGRPLAGLDIDEYRAKQIGFVFQSFHLMPELSALENIQVPMFEGGLRPAERQERAIALITEVGLAHRKDHRPGQLSVGERQRIAIARALANEPCLLLADEPTGNLDSASQEEILELLNGLRQKRGLALLIVTHSQDVARAADRQIRMKDGQILID